MTSPDSAEEPAAASGTEPVPAARIGLGEPVEPEQSPEDTDAAWGDYRERDDDRLYRDRPPHWADY